MPQHELVRFQAPWLPPLEEVVPFFAAAQAARWFSNGGPCVAQLERECADYLGMEHPGVLVNNATSGLMIALRACLGVPTEARRLVAVPSFTFVASLNAIMWAGFDPVFIDIDPDDWHPSLESLEQLHHVRDNLVGILQCSTFGTAPSSARRSSLAEATKALGVPVVVDSAAGFGSVDETGDTLGGQGGAEVFSFHATKPFAIGEGGYVSSRSAETLKTVTRLANFGFDETRSIPGHAGINAKLPELSAAMGLAVMRHFDQILERRRKAAEWLRSELQTVGVRFQSGSQGSASQFVPIRMPSSESRQRLLRNAQAARVEVRAYFDPPMHAIAPFSRFHAAGCLENTESLSGQIIALPMANDISGYSLERIRDLVLSAL